MVENTGPRSGDLGSEIDPLPFTYTRVLDASVSQYSHKRISGIQVVGEPQNEPRSDDDIVGRVKNDFEGSQWYYLEYWRRKGLPSEEIHFQLGDRIITLYNFNSEIPFSDERIEETNRVLAGFSSRFPQALDKLDYILIDDIQPSSYYGDSENYPANGQAMSGHRALKLHPRAFSDIRHRVEAASNFEGTLVHELTHPIDSQFEFAGWRDKYKWETCLSAPDDWDYRDVPDGGSKAFYNINTGKMALIDIFSLQPEECVTEYATHNLDDDVCESVVAYFYDPELLNRVSPTKYGFIKSLDVGLPEPEITVIRIPAESIQLPEIKPQEVKYYIEEPAN